MSKVLCKAAVSMEGKICPPLCRNTSACCRRAGFYHVPCLGQPRCSSHAALSTLLTPPQSNQVYHQLLQRLVFLSAPLWSA